MSWYGSHPKIGKLQARAILPGAPCKRTVYLLRVFIHEGRAQTDPCCYCGCVIDFDRAREALVQAGH